MRKSKIIVQLTESTVLPEDAIMLGESIMKARKIPRSGPVILKFGAYRQHVKIIPSPKTNGMRMSGTLAARMGIHAGHPSRVGLRLQYDADTGTLALGPLIGVLVSRDYPDAPEKPFGSITMFCRELVEACKAQGAYVFFFTPDLIGDNAEGTEGWVYSGKWQRVWLPAPDVINNRLTSRRLENKPNVQQFIAETKHAYGTSIFNEKFLDKTEVFDALQKNNDLRRYLPESHQLRNIAILKAMCSRYSSVFLKPVRGSLGKGIIRISRLGADGYQAMHATSAGYRRQTYPTIAKLYASLASKMKMSRYQIQQGLHLIEIGKRPVDFRALAQKNAAGKWMVTSIVARTAGEQHFVSNLARGGTLSPVGVAVAKANISKNSQDAALRLRQAALHIAQGVDDSIPAHFGELGIDLALDANGKVWLLEVNSKPSKNDNTPLNEGKIRPSVRMMIQYSRHLTGF
ncbi:YheC/YheD family protein [Paenibacillus sp. J5C_2022]|uniref:YheC/YheD family endospore coat-associated protein n=1 Tax=Paenibacillus sp. J5C2022 TaxID=2977129 RepID=UPI0021CF3234|nr:YheC/YheD family protein [Paenibacillus sp. J5C2022]MCU6712427.1 YheC/YheD family protein [Paenibacillus sp. J5C2022]